MLTQRQLGKPAFQTLTDPESLYHLVFDPFLIHRGYFIEMFSYIGPPGEPFEVVGIKKRVHTVGLNLAGKAVYFSDNNFRKGGFSDTGGSEKGIESGF